LNSCNRYCLIILISFLISNRRTKEFAKSSTSATTTRHIASKQSISTLLSEEEESFLINQLIDSFNQQTSLFEVTKAYLLLVASLYDKRWPNSLNDIYISLFKLLNSSFDLFQAIHEEFKNSSENSMEFRSLCSIIITYIELELSKYKQAKQKYEDEGKRRHNNRSPSTHLQNTYNIELNTQLQSIIYKLLTIESYLLNAASFISNENRESFIIRVYSLIIYSSLNDIEEKINTGYYLDLLNKAFFAIESHSDTSQNNKSIIVANSEILELINKGTYLFYSLF
jgi:hypothetical protein